MSVHRNAAFSEAGKHLSVCPDADFKKRDDTRQNVQLRECSIYCTAQASHKSKGDYDGHHDNPLNQDPFSPFTVKRGNSEVEPAVNVSHRELCIINVPQIYYGE